MMEDNYYGVRGFEFSEDSIKRGFIRKVYSILMVQLSITLGFICLFMYHEPTQKYVQQHSELFIISLVILLVSMVTLACCGNLRRKSPMNFIILLLFTGAESFVLGVTASYYKTDTVLIAVGITAAVSLGLTIFAFQTKIDFTLYSGIIYVSVLVLLIFGIISIFFHNRILDLIYSSLVALLFSIYLVIDTQMMMGGKHRYNISPEEYIFAALNLYVDIINIFISILDILSSKDR